MTHYQKHWVAFLQKKYNEDIPAVVTSPQKSIELKIRSSTTRLNSGFKDSEKRLHAEFAKPTWVHTNIPQEILEYRITQYVDALWQESVNDYIFLCTSQYIYGQGLLYQDAAITKGMRNFEESITREIVEFIVNALVQYYTFQEKVKEAVPQIISEAKGNISELCSRIGTEINSAWNKIENLAYQRQIHLALNRLAQSGHATYRYICENSSETCDLCASLNGQEFEIKDAKTGENLPPMHPHCKCAVAAPENSNVAFDFEEFIASFNSENIINNIIENLQDTLDNMADSASDIWQFFLGESFNDLYGSFTTIDVGGVKYRINRYSFSAVALDSNGALIVPENASEYDIKLLELMKKRDTMSKDSNEYAAVLAEIQALINSTDPSLLKVNPKHTYDFYVLGGDVTDQLNNYMRQTEVDYADMHSRYWAENLLNFRRLVGNSSIMDLKNQPEWQHSACIYDGEIVDQDAMGNINYGFFGRHCNIPEAVLMVGAGYAQISAGTSDWDFWITFGDDPRDSYRVIQGIDIYEQWH